MTESVQTEQKKTLDFQTEAKKLLKLMINSLYSNKEIFLRELVSNASDAADRLRFGALSQPELLADDADLKIVVEFDKEAKTITITDNGIGMNEEDVIANLGTIAKSGTDQFFQTLTGDQQKDAQLIGQFGVGFYSSFIVADRVEVITRKAGTPADQGVHWESAGEADFSIEPIHREQRGTSVILHLKPEGVEFADEYRLRNIIKKYADHISIPVQMLKQETPDMPTMPNMEGLGEDAAKAMADAMAKEAEAAKEGKDEDENKEPEFETINSAQALWVRPRTEVKEDEYKEFYKHVSHDFQDPLLWSHNRVEGKLEYTSLLYIPAKAPFDLWNREKPRGLKLYIQRVFIMDEAEQFLPLYLRFVKGIVDSNNLSLNVSREILQQDPVVDKMRSALTKRILDMLDKMAKNDKEQYAKFWQEFGQVLKEGPAEDFSNKERVAKLLRFASTHTDQATPDQSLEDYIGRMKEGQEKIFYVCADSFNGAKSSLHLELFRKKGVEVLLLFDRIDGWLMEQLSEFDGKKLHDVAKGDIDLSNIGEPESEEDSKQREEAEKNFEGLLERSKEILSEQVEEVRLSRRLTDSPACIVGNEMDMGAQMRRIMEAAGQPVPPSKQIFELNPDHELVSRLNEETSDDRFAELVHVLFDQAKLAAGDSLDDPSEFVRRVNKLLLAS